MLWWFIGAWLASGTVLPAFLLFRMAYRGLAAAKVGPKGLHFLSGLVGVGLGALILWFVCSFSDSSTAMRDTPSASAVAQTIDLPPSVNLSLSPAQFSAAQAGPPLRGEAEQVGSIQPGIGAFGQSAGDDADTVVSQALLTAPLHPKPGIKRRLAHRYASGSTVGPYITHSSSRGLWLFAPNGNEGANN
jgi:hypothetical protein